MPRRKRKIAPEEKPQRGIHPAVQKAINSVHPTRVESYRAVSHFAFESYLKTWLAGTTLQRYKDDNGKPLTLTGPEIAQQIKSWVNAGRPYKYNGFWEKEGIDTHPIGKKEQQTEAPVQKKRRRRRRTA